MLFIYYLPIWFQAIKGASAVKSGIMNLPVVLSLVVASITAGVGVSHLGYSVPFMYASAIIMSIGAGFLTTFTTSTGHEKWIGYQVLFGFGLGLGMQQASVVAQTVLERKDVPTGASVIMLSQSLGGAISLAIGQTVFTNSLVTNLRGAVPGQDGDDLAQFVVNVGATELHNIVSTEDLPPVLTAYNEAVTDAFLVGLAFACAAIIGAVFTKWVSVKAKSPKKDVESSTSSVEKRTDEA